MATLSASGAGVAARMPEHDIYTVVAEGDFLDGSHFEASDCVMLVGEHAGHQEIEAVPARAFELRGNHPNPFNPQTRISFYLPGALHVRLEIFNVLGQHVATLIDRKMEAGEQTVIWDGSEAASGIYYYRLRAGDQTATSNMLLLK